MVPNENDNQTNTTPPGQQPETGQSATTEATSSTVSPYSSTPVSQPNSTEYSAGTTVSNNASANMPVPGKKKLSKKVKILVIATIGVVVLAGSSAAAYFGYVVPNKPENVLKTAIGNALQSKQSTFDGTLSMKSTDEADFGFAGNVTVDFKGSGDIEKGTGTFEAEVAVAGVKTPLELRVIDKSIYFKFSNLSAVEAIGGNFLPEAKPLIKKVSSKVTNQWIEIDDSLLGAEASKCTFGGNWNVTDEDLDTIFKIYQETPFAAITKTTTENISGSEAYKYDIVLKDKETDKASEEMVKRVSILKKLDECLSTDLENDEGDTDNTYNLPMALWVDKSKKQIVKVALYVDEKEKNETGFDGELVMNLKEGAAAVEKPAGAKSATILMTELQALIAEDPMFLMLMGGGFDASMDLEQN